MSDLNDLYQEVILDHSQHPRNFKEMPQAMCSANGHNPLCGDQLTLYMNFLGDTIQDIHFQGSGCAISKSSASLMTESVKGKTKAEALKLFDLFQHLIKGEAASITHPEDLGKLAVFSGVSQFPTRVKCALLSWHTLKSALKNETKTASTE